MKIVSAEKVIDKESLKVLSNGDKVENDVFCVEKIFDAYYVFFRLGNLDVVYLGIGFSVARAMDIMKAFSYGCFYTTIEEITYGEIE